jgi:hypothetical protein
MRGTVLYGTGDIRFEDTPSQRSPSQRMPSYGSRKRCGVNLGTIRDYPTEAAAMKAASALRANIKHGNPSRPASGDHFRDIGRTLPAEGHGRGLRKNIRNVRDV